MPNTRCSLLPPLAELEAQRRADATEPGSVASVAPDEPLLVALVVLTGVEEEAASIAARARAIKGGVAEPKPNEPIYDLAVMVQTLLLGCVDNDSDPVSPVPFFDSADQILQNLNRDQITYLFAQHEHWQDECSPQAQDLSEEGFYGWLVGVAESESPSDFFAKLRPSTLWNYTRTSARLLLISPAGKSAAGSTSETSTESDTSPAKTAADG